MWWAAERVYVWEPVIVVLPPKTGLKQNNRTSGRKIMKLQGIPWFTTSRDRDRPVHE